MRRFLCVGVLLLSVVLSACDNRGGYASGKSPSRLVARGGLDLQSIEGGNVQHIKPASALGCTSFGLPPDAVVATYGVAAAAFSNGATTTQDSFWSLVGTAPLHSGGKLVNTLRCTANLILVGSNQGLEWVSTLDLTSGSFSSASINGNPVTALLPLDATHVLAGLQNANGGAASPAVTCDIGALTCAQPATGFGTFGGGDFVTSFYRFPGGTILAGLNVSGLFRSTDGGQTFSPVNVGTSAAFLVRSFVGSGSNVFLADASGVFKSTNDGQSWTSMSAGLGSGLLFPSAFAGDGTTMSLAINSATESTPAALFKTTNGAVSWQKIGSGMTAQYVNDLTTTPSDGWAATNAGVFRTADGGATWSPFNAGLDNTGVYRVVASGSTLYAGTYNNTNGVYRSLDGGNTWLPANAFMNNRRVRALAVVGTNVVVGGETGTFRSTDGGATFAAAGTGLPAGTSIYAMAVSGGTIYAGLFESGFAHSTDGGATWVPGASPGTNAFVTAVAANGSAVVAAGNQLVYRSSDGGATWQAGSAIVPSDSSYSVYSLTFAQGALWAGLQGFGGTQTHGLAKSTDLGATWTRPGDIPANVDVYDVQAAGSLLLAATGSGLYESADGGSTFTSVYPDLASTSVLSIATVGTTYHLGTYGRGLFSISEPAVARRLLPVVLDVVNGSAHYTTEAALTNTGTTTAAVTLLYTASSGSGSGTVSTTLASGKQLIIPDVIAYLRENGLAIPTSGQQVGTLLATFEGLSDGQAAFVTGRTTTTTAAPQPVGAAGLAYLSTDPASGSMGALRVYGLRESSTDRSNVAIYNSSDVPVTVSVTAFSGSGNGASSVVESAAVLPPWGWKQYNRVLQGPGYATGWVLVERVSTSGAFGAYGVINDDSTNDGSFIPAVAPSVPPAFMDVPVLVETPTFRSELVLTNASASPATFTMTFTESLAAGVGASARTALVPAPIQLELPPMTEVIHAEAVDWLRSLGASVGPMGAASYAGSLHITVSGVSILDTNAGSRSAAVSPAGGQFGFYSPARLPGDVAFDVGWIYGLRADANNRTNLAVMNRAATSSGGSITVRAWAFDGDAGGTTPVGSSDFTLGPGQWQQMNGFLSGFGVSNGYVRLQLLSGTSPWDAYAVINDGGSPGQRTGDGAFLPVSTSYTY